MFFNNVLLPLLLNLGAGIVVIAGIWTIQQWRYYSHLRMKFHNYRFDIRNKGSEQIIRTAVVQVDNNTLFYFGKQIKEGANSVQGEFAGCFLMNVINLNVGEGYHFHKKYHGYNFPKIIIRGTTFYTQNDYIGPGYKLE